MSHEDIRRFVKAVMLAEAKRLAEAKIDRSLPPSAKELVLAELLDEEGLWVQATKEAKTKCARFLAFTSVEGYSAYKEYKGK